MLTLLAPDPKAWGGFTKATSVLTVLQGAYTQLCEHMSVKLQTTLVVFAVNAAATALRIGYFRHNRVR